MSKKYIILYFVGVLISSITASALTDYLHSKKHTKPTTVKSQIVAKPEEKADFKDPVWIPIKGTNVKVDANSVKTSKHVTSYINKQNLVEAWEKLSASNSETVIVYTVYDCDNATMALLVGSRYDKDSNVIGDGFDYMGSKDAFLDFKTNWKAIPPDTTAYTTAKVLCGK